MSTTINQNIRADIEKIIQQEFPGHELVVLTTRVKDKKTVSVEAGVIKDNGLIEKTYANLCQVAKSEYYVLF